MIADANIQYSTFQWESTVKTLRQMLIAKAHMEEGDYTLWHIRHHWFQEVVLINNIL